MRHLAIGRILGLLLTVISLVVAVMFVNASFYFHSQFQQWTTARPLETKIDLSRPGSVTVPFHQTCSVAWSEYMMLECPLGDESDKVLEEQLQSLSGALVIRDQSGNEVVNQKLKGVHTTGVLDRGIVLIHFPTFREGDYQATISIDSGVPALAGYPQTVYARYLLTGLEQLPVYRYRALAVSAGVVCLIAGLVVLPDFCRFGIWKNQTAEEVPTEAQPGETDPLGEWFV